MRKLFLVVVGVLAMLLVGAVTAPAAAPGPNWLVVTAHSARAVNAEDAVLTIKVKDEIPKEANDYIITNLGVGFAWADLNTGKVFVMTIHPTLGVDSIQNPTGWHAHAVTLTGGATSRNDFCIKSVDSKPFVHFSVSDNRMRVRVALSDLPEPASQLTAAAGFTIERDSACASTLAVRLSTGNSEEE